MRIRDVISEAGFLAGYQQGKKIADKVLTPTKWLQGTKIKTGYDTGYDKMDKLLTPSRWLEPGQEKSSSDKLPHHSVVKQTLTRAASGETLYPRDIDLLKQIKEKVDDREIKTADPRAISLALTAAIKRQTLSDQQRNDIQALLNQI